MKYTKKRKQQKQQQRKQQGVGAAAKKMVKLIKMEQNERTHALQWYYAAKYTHLGVIGLREAESIYNLSQGCNVLSGYRRQKPGRAAFNIRYSLPVPRHMGRLYNHNAK